MSFDLQACLRAVKPHKQRRPLRRRPDGDLPWASGAVPIGSALFLDTTVYIDVVQARIPQVVDELMASRTCHHSAVSLAELTHAFGRLDPAEHATPTTLRRIEHSIERIPEHRLHAPDSATWASAGMLAGEVARLTGSGKGASDARRWLNDALIYLQARALGARVLTRNVIDFDYINQLVPSGRIVLYRDADLRS